MGGGQHLHRRAEHRPRADAYRRYVEHDAVEVHEHVFFGVDVIAVVAEERRLDPEYWVRVRKQGGDNFGCGRLVAVVGNIEPVGQLAGVFALGRQLGVGGDVEFAGEHFFFFSCHGRKETTDYSDYTDLETQFLGPHKRLRPGHIVFMDRRHGWLRVIETQVVIGIHAGKWGAHDGIIAQKEAGLSFQQEAAPLPR